MRVPIERGGSHRGLEALLRRQGAAFTSRQAREQGLTPSTVRAHLAAHRWQRAAPRVLVAFTGPMPPVTRRWVAVLYAGPGALLSHGSAAELWGLPHPGDTRVHVTVPAARRVRARPGIAVHRSRLSPDPVDGLGDRDPPRTSVEATVLDLAVASPRVATALALVADACRLGLTTRDRLARELARRPTSRHRAALHEAAADVAGGAHSPLELRYLRDVERAHRLPTGTRQRPTTSTRQDVHYEGLATTVELDGRRGHQGETARWRDMHGDNASALRGEVTLRYGWDDVGTRPCGVAAQVAAVLAARGWTGAARRCPRCPAA